MFIAKIRRYTSRLGNTFMEVQIPQRVTITGKEDHFARAYEDVSMILAGMRALDDAEELRWWYRRDAQAPDEVIYDVVSLASTHPGS